MNRPKNPRAQRLRRTAIRSFRLQQMKRLSTQQIHAENVSFLAWLRAQTHPEDPQ